MHHNSELDLLWFDPLCFNFVLNTSQGICLEVIFVILHHDSEFDPLCFSFVPNTSQGICLEVKNMLFCIMTVNLIHCVLVLYWILLREPVWKYLFWL